MLKWVVSEEIACVGVRWRALWPEAVGRGSSGPGHVWRHSAGSHVRRHVLRWIHRPGVATHIIWRTVGSGCAHVRIPHVWIVVHGSGLPAHHVWIASLVRRAYIAPTLHVPLLITMDHPISKSMS